jgi:8-oxo-dGTP pyrophosphatase MutT (NUDIX family)
MNVKRKSRVGFVVIKLHVGTTAYFLMRLNSKWKDVNFIGGHEKMRDSENLATTARRELWEEVPSIRSYPSLELLPLSGEVHYGPINSPSRGEDVEYELQFFLLKFDHAPQLLVEALSLRSKNVWVTQEELIEPGKFRVSGLAKLLDQVVPGGLAAIPYSSETDLGPLRERFEGSDGRQLSFVLK